MALEKGIDVSEFQGKIDWTKVRGAGYTAAAIKASEGLTWVDPDFVVNYNGAMSAGMHVCLYHFGRPENDPIAEANHFIETARKVGNGHGPLVLDVETTGGKNDVSQWTVDFLNHVHALTGLPVAWYSGDSFVSEHLQAVKIPYPDWLASYGTQPSHKWVAWQMTDKGRVPGINGYVDLDEFDSSFFVPVDPNVVTNVTEIKATVDGHPIAAIGVPVNNTVKTFILWTVVKQLGIVNTYRGKGLFELNGRLVQGKEYKDATYLPWDEILPEELTPHFINGVMEFEVQKPEPAPVQMPVPVSTPASVPAPVTTTPAPVQSKGDAIIKFMMNRGNVVTLVLAVISALKLVLSAQGINLGITDAQANEIVNAVASIVTVFGVFMTHGGQK